MITRAVPLEERLYSRIDKNGPVPESKPELGCCWVWTGKSKNRGYGVATAFGKLRYVFHLMYEKHIGAIPEGLELDHLCRNTLCVNPRHLEPVTTKENVLRGEGLCAVNKRKTHCKKGHELSGENLDPVTARSGRRSCLICRLAHDKARAAADRAKRKAAAVGLPTA